MRDWLLLLIDCANLFINSMWEIVNISWMEILVDIKEIGNISLHTIISLSIAFKWSALHLALHIIHWEYVQERV